MSSLSPSPSPSRISRSPVSIHQTSTQHELEQLRSARHDLLSLQHLIDDLRTEPTSLPSTPLRSTGISSQPTSHMSTRVHAGSPQPMPTPSPSRYTYTYTSMPSTPSTSYLSRSNVTSPMTTSYRSHPITPTSAPATTSWTPSTSTSTWTPPPYISSYVPSYRASPISSYTPSYIPPYISSYRSPSIPTPLSPYAGIIDRSIHSSPRHATSVNNVPKTPPTSVSTNYLSSSFTRPSTSPTPLNFSFTNNNTTYTSPSAHVKPLQVTVTPPPPLPTTTTTTERPSTTDSDDDVAVTIDSASVGEEQGSSHIIKHVYAATDSGNEDGFNDDDDISEVDSNLDVHTLMRKKRSSISSHMTDDSFIHELDEISPVKGKDRSIKDTTKFMHDVSILASQGIVDPDLMLLVLRELHAASQTLSIPTIRRRTYRFLSTLHQPAPSLLSTATAIYGPTSPTAANLRATQDPSRLSLDTTQDGRTDGTISPSSVALGVGSAMDDVPEMEEHLSSSSTSRTSSIAGDDINDSTVSSIHVQPNIRIVDDVDEQQSRWEQHQQQRQRQTSVISSMSMASFDDLREVAEVETEREHDTFAEGDEIDENEYVDEDDDDDDNDRDTQDGITSTYNPSSLAVSPPSSTRSSLHSETLSEQLAALEQTYDTLPRPPMDNDNIDEWETFEIKRSDSIGPWSVTSSPPMNAIETYDIPSQVNVGRSTYDTSSQLNVGRSTASTSLLPTSGSNSQNVSPRPLTRTDPHVDQRQWKQFQHIAKSASNSRATSTATSPTHTHHTIKPPILQDEVADESDSDVSIDEDDDDTIDPALSVIDPLIDPLIDHAIHTCITPEWIDAMEVKMSHMLIDHSSFATYMMKYGDTPGLQLTHSQLMAISRSIMTLLTSQLSKESQNGNLDRHVRSAIRHVIMRHAPIAPSAVDVDTYDSDSLHRMVNSTPSHTKSPSTIMSTIIHDIGAILHDEYTYAEMVRSLQHAYEDEMMELKETMKSRQREEISRGPQSPTGLNKRPLLLDAISQHLESEMHQLTKTRTRDFSRLYTQRLKRWKEYKTLHGTNETDVVSDEESDDDIQVQVAQTQGKKDAPATVTGTSASTSTSTSTSKPAAKPKSSPEKKTTSSAFNFGRPDADVAEDTSDVDSDTDTDDLTSLPIASASVSRKRRASEESEFDVIDTSSQSRVNRYVTGMAAVDTSVDGDELRKAFGGWKDDDVDEHGFRHVPIYDASAQSQSQLRQLEPDDESDVSDTQQQHVEETSSDEEDDVPDISWSTMQSSLSQLIDADRQAREELSQAETLAEMLRQAMAQEEEDDEQDKDDDEDDVGKDAMNVVGVMPTHDDDDEDNDDAEVGVHDLQHVIPQDEATQSALERLRAHAQSFIDRNIHNLSSTPSTSTSQYDDIANLMIQSNGTRMNGNGHDTTAFTTTIVSSNTLGNPVQASKEASKAAIRALFDAAGFPQPPKINGHTTSTSTSTSANATAETSSSSSSSSSTGSSSNSNTASSSPSTSTSTSTAAPTASSFLTMTGSRVHFANDPMSSSRAASASGTGTASASTTAPSSSSSTNTPALPSQIPSFLNMSSSRAASLQSQFNTESRTYQQRYGGMAPSHDDAGDISALVGEDDLDPTSHTSYSFDPAQLASTRPFVNNMLLDGFRDTLRSIGISMSEIDADYDQHYRHEDDDELDELEHELEDGRFGAAADDEFDIPEDISADEKAESGTYLGDVNEPETVEFAPVAVSSQSRRVEIRVRSADEEEKRTRPNSNSSPPIIQPRSKRN